MRPVSFKPLMEGIYGIFDELKLIGIFVLTLVFDPQPITLQGRHVRLEPLGLQHAEGLYRISQDEDIWQYLPRPMPRDINGHVDFVNDALASNATGNGISFAIIYCGDNCVAGSTRYLDIQLYHNTLEIGWSWIGKAYQRKRINTESNFLLLSHAFEVLGAKRVTFNADKRNAISQKAITRIGARKEGVLRKHRRNWDGHTRDTVCFSIIDSEWLDAKRGIEKLLGYEV